MATVRYFVTDVERAIRHYTETSVSRWSGRWARRVDRCQSLST